MIDKSKLISVMAEAIYDNIGLSGDSDEDYWFTNGDKAAEAALQALCRELPEGKLIPKCEGSSRMINDPDEREQAYDELKEIGK